MLRNRKLFAACLLTLAACVTSGCVTINVGPSQGGLQEATVSGAGKDKVLLLDLSGVINSNEKDGLFPKPSMLAEFKETLTLAAKDTHVKAVVLRINSPGGTVTASDILYHELRAFKAQRNVPVVASIMDIGTSGGYYVAAAADAILAHPSTVTGSIGVIMLSVNARGLLEKIGVEGNAITSGPRKDMGSPFRGLKDEERAIFQSVIDDFYARFLAVVKEGRPKLSAEQIRTLADGRIYSGDQAKATGLVDDLGYLDDAIEVAKKKAGLADAKVVAYRRPGEYRNNIYSQVVGPVEHAGPLSSLDLMALVRGGSPQFMYLWMP